jgi:dTDP-4-dehydrorhamnose 3,5-epimerase
MNFEPTPLPGAWVIRPEYYRDERGFFARSYDRGEFESRGMNPDIAQCNISHNPRRGTLRGMHFQVAPHAEAKLVRCTRGSLYDVIIDMRPSSSTYLKHFGIVLDAENRLALYIPEEFAHGYLTLADDTEVFYQMSAFYQPGAARGLRWNDPAFGIACPSEVTVIAERDRDYPDFLPPLD